jgi:hypothetical protein
MNKLLTLLFVITTFATLCKAQEIIFEKKAWEGLKPGMAESQVKQLVGDPVRFESFTTVRYQSNDTSVYWRYPDNKVVVFTNHLFDRIEDDREALLKYIQQRAFKKGKEGLVIVSNGKK